MIAFEATARETGLLMIFGGALLLFVGRREGSRSFLGRFDLTAGALFAVLGVCFVLGS